MVKYSIEKVKEMSVPVIDLKKLITSIILDTRSHGYICDATVSRYPTYIDKETKLETLIKSNTNMQGIKRECTLTVK